MAIVVCAALGLWLLSAHSVAYAQGLVEAPPAYRTLPFFGSRVPIWIVAQLHLMFAAFVLGVPIFALIVEIIGWRTRDPKYDRLAHEFTHLLTVSVATTAAFGGVFLFLLTVLYPRFFGYLADVFSPTLLIYPLLFFGEAFTLYIYYHSWERMQRHKGWHILIGVALNLFGTALMFLANAWATFAISPAGIDQQGKVVSLWAAINNPLWTPLNVHRLIANVAFGGAVVGLYAAFRFLGSRTEVERARYDWMGYVGNFIAVASLIPLPFAGYWFAREIYGFNQQMGITMMGGFLSWLWVVQALLIGVVFLATNYYLWMGLGRIAGGERYTKYVKYLILVLGLGFLVWVTPHSLVASLEEARRIGAAHHPMLGVLGVMSAKNTAVNLMILTTFVSFLFYRRAGKDAVAAWKTWGLLGQAVVLGLAAGVVIFLGIYGYFVPALVRIGFSVYQVLAVLTAMVLATIIDVLLFRGARTVGAIAWGRMPARSQYALLILATTFTWLMGLMGYARNAIRQHWHVFGVMQDTSTEAFSPTLGYAANVISLTVVLFLSLMAFVFWVTGLHREPVTEEEMVQVPGLAPAPAIGNPSPGPANPGGKDNPGPRGKGGPAKWPTFVVFLAVIGAYTYFANSIPQIESRPPQEFKVTEGMAPEALAESGRRIVEGKGGCLVCHGLGSGGARAPDLAGVGARASNRQPGLSAEAYLRESLLEPTKFLVEGFPPIMPAVDKPPTSLTQGEIVAVIAFLQSQGGQITVKPPIGEISPIPSPPPKDSTGQIQAIVQKAGCNLCHVIPGIEGAVGAVGPDLTGVGRRLDLPGIKQSILEPDAAITPGFAAGIMPKDYRQKLTPAEVETLGSYLSTLK